MSYSFFVKSNIVFGRGAVEKLPQILKGHGLKKVMIVYDAGVKAAGIAKQIVESHDGTLLLDNRPGDGCTFTISLPITVTA